MAWCETNGIDYIFGLSGTKPLARKVDEVADDIRTRRAIENLPVLRGYTETRHKAKSWDRERRTVARIDDVKKLGATYATSLYDYKVGRTILDHICNPPDDSMQTFCAGDTSRGPYIFTYERPASDMEPVPPPFLFVDLSDIHPGAFGELVSAFRAQVKREDLADGVRINTPRLALLQIVLKGADLLPGVQKTVGDIVHSVGIGGKK
ncbi:hypothetical protein ACVMHY_010490 [Bradyrhizobium barranii subsp. barranii]